MKGKTSSFTHAETFDIYIQIVLKRIFKCVLKYRNMHILFYEQAEYERVIKMEKSFLDDGIKSKMSSWNKKKKKSLHIKKEF